ncbi:transposase [Streptomyces sp. NPDC002730]|uniref:transposase n=1 Tax=Streptomyces sp. NPDC002730 TaxID=3364662 RepID=UPI0036884FA1
MLVRDRLDVLFEDEEFADLYPADGRPGFSPGQLALVSVLQFAEDLSDRAAAQAVRTRIDWKYALGLELEDTGFDYSLLCDFRARLVEGNAADRMLRVMLTRLAEAGLLKSGRAAAYRRDVCAGRGATSQPAGAGRGEPARRSGGTGRDRAGVAAAAGRT